VNEGLIADWALDPAVTHLNHGSYGGCPRAVVAAANALRGRLEAAPMTFYIRDWQGELDAARARLAAFVGATADRLAFVPSATGGVAIALAAAAPTIDSGDELVVTDHGYRAVRNQVDRLAAARGARVVVVALPRPFDADAAVDAVVAATTRRTRVAVIDHITSPTALVLPVARIVAALTARGVATIVDGAHAPGQVDLRVDALGATWYVGNNHKWCCAVKASGFVVAAPAVAARTRPLVTSHGASADYGPANRYHAELDWAGTHDPAAYLTVPLALDEVARLGGGWPTVRARNHATALAMRARLAGELAAPGTPAAPPPPDDIVGTMTTVPIALPAGTPAVAVTTALVAAGWELPVFDAPGGGLVRLSAHLYNEVTQLDGLARALRGLGVVARSP
jgi:isopenicillin-N epimerase